MSDYLRCKTCQEHGWFNSSVFPRHVCKPIWECRGAWANKDPGAWTDVHAADAEEAAEKFAERYDCEGGDYSIISGKHRDPVVIHVRKPDSETFELWDIEAEAVPTYRATKVKS